MYAIKCNNILKHKLRISYLKLSSNLPMLQSSHSTVIMMNNISLKDLSDCRSLQAAGLGQSATRCPHRDVHTTSQPPDVPPGPQGDTKKGDL